MKKISLVLLLIFIIFLFIEPKSKHINKITNFNTLMIAHAGGGIDNNTYTNSYEALNYNYKKGFKYFEIDFSFTKDFKLVCLHDWEKDFTSAFGKNISRPTTLEEFEKLNDKYQYTKCTLDGLNLWLEKHPNSFIITDVKDDNIRALNIIKETMKNKINRFIPQIYDPDNFNKIKELGFEQIIWTLYRYNGSNEDVIDSIKEFYANVAITMPTYRLDKKLILDLKRLNVNTYTHTINDINTFNEFQSKFNIDNVYTDFLTPKKVK